MPVVLEGLTIGLSLTLIVAVLTFVLHQRLPYKKMLVLTGIMIGGVLLVMVGEQVQEMQQAGWCSITKVAFVIPQWMGTWFALFPNLEGLVAQAMAAIFVIGSYFAAQYVSGRHNVATLDSSLRPLLEPEPIKAVRAQSDQVRELADFGERV